jgi:hypothetical protein
MCEAARVLKDSKATEKKLLLIPWNRVREAISLSTGQEIFHLQWKQKIHYRVHKSPPLDPILNQINPVHNLTSHFN